MKKCLIAVLLLAAPLLAQKPVQAQDQAEIALNGAGCGPSAVTFDVTADKNQHPLVPPEAGKAQVYVISWVYATTKIGVDGSWAGASRYKSYLSFSVNPGDHHLCISDQRDRFSGSAISFSAQAGQAHFFFLSPRETRWKLEEVDPARGMFLIAGSALSSSHPRK